MSLSNALERAAKALSEDSSSIGKAGGDPARLLTELDEEGQLRVLHWLFQEDLSAAEALAMSWSEEVAGPKALLSVDGQGLSKSARKVLRRVHHKLRSRGYEVAGEEPAARVASLPAVEEEIRAGFISGVDPSGGQLVYRVERNPTGGARVFEVVLNNALGILDFDVLGDGRSQVRRFMKELASRKRFPCIPAPVEAVAALVSRALARQPSGTALPKKLAQWKSKVDTGLSEELPVHEVRRALEIGDSSQGLRRAEEMIRQGNLGPWPGSREETEAAALSVREAGATGAIIVSEKQQKASVEGAVSEILKKRFGDEGSLITRERFEDQAYFLWHRQEIEDARACLAAAEFFEKAEPEENPVARALLEMALNPWLESLEKAEQQSEPGLTGKP